MLAVQEEVIVAHIFSSSIVDVKFYIYNCVEFQCLWSWSQCVVFVIAMVNFCFFFLLSWSLQGHHCHHIRSCTESYENASSEYIAIGSSLDSKSLWDSQTQRLCTDISIKYDYGLLTWTSAWWSNLASSMQLSNTALQFLHVTLSSLFQIFLERVISVVSAWSVFSRTLCLNQWNRFTWPKKKL